VTGVGYKSERFREDSLQAVSVHDVRKTAKQKFECLLRKRFCERLEALHYVPTNTLLYFVTGLC
jgi:hypothetical protein